MEKLLSKFKITNQDVLKNEILLISKNFTFVVKNPQKQNFNGKIFTDTFSLGEGFYQNDKNFNNKFTVNENFKKYFKK